MRLFIAEESKSHALRFELKLLFSTKAKATPLEQFVD